MAQRPALRKREIVLAVALGAVAAGGAGITLAAFEDDDSPSRALVKIYNLSEFSKLEVLGPQSVQVTRGDTYSVRAEGDSEALNGFEVVIEDGVLKIRPRGALRPDVNWSRLHGTTFHVTVPKLEAVALQGSGDIRVDWIETPNFAATVTGSGDLLLESIKVDSATFTLSGSGDVRVAGESGETRVSITGSGEVDGRELQSKVGDVTISGSGETALTVNGDARVTLSGRGDIDILGAANCQVTRTGSGDVRCGGD